MLVIAPLPVIPSSSAHLTGQFQRHHYSMAMAMQSEQRKNTHQYSTLHGPVPSNTSMTSQRPNTATSSMLEKCGQARSNPEKSLTKLSHGTFPMPPVRASNTVKSAFKENLEDSSTTYSPSEDSGYSEVGRSSRFECVVAVKKRDLNTDVHKTSKFHAANIGARRSRPTKFSQPRKHKQ